MRLAGALNLQRERACIRLDICVMVFDLAQGAEIALKGKPGER